MLGVQNNANNFGYSSGLLANTIANRPIRAALGTLFVSTDTLLLYRWTGSAWVEISGGGGGILSATNGLTVYDGTAVGLGGTLSQPETIIEGDTRLWRTRSNEYDQGFDLNFDGEIYQFGILENTNERSLYTRFENANIITLAADVNSLYQLQVTHSEFNYYLTYVFDYYDSNTYSFNPFLSNQYTTFINHSNKDVDGEETTFTIVGQFTIQADALAQIVHYNLLNIPSYANNAAALSAGLIVGDIYRHSSGAGDALNIVH